MKIHELTRLKTQIEELHLALIDYVNRIQEK